ncbi:hypothetical protein LIER_13639 [Lithospermum erythrorhizon]|uniref:Uncharacterized protein n=1 Tax=Lithospermum erythrorhizon TaxID=34254 RepID=A0AAV3Q1F0_LITER
MGCTVFLLGSWSTIAFPLASDSSSLNPSLYDCRVYERECPYVKVASPGPPLGSSATHSCGSSSDSTDTSSASSSSYHSPVLDKGVSKTVTL